MAYSEAQKKATLKYREKVDIVKLTVDMKREEREKYKVQAAEHGMSLSAYIIHLLEEDK
jgi:predicted HicB family RNase H-like nuclease